MQTEYFLIGVWGMRTNEFCHTQTCSIRLTLTHDGSTEGETVAMKNAIGALEYSAWEAIKTYFPPYCTKEQCSWQSIAITPLLTAAKLPNVSGISYDY